jgi:hypothetical protein
MLPLAGSPLGFVAIRAELLGHMAIEAAKELSLPILLVVNSPLESYTSLER